MCLNFVEQIVSSKLNFELNFDLNILMLYIKDQGSSYKTNSLDTRHKRDSQYQVDAFLGYK